VQRQLAAMEPALDGRDDSSRKTSQLSSADSRLRERSGVDSRLAFPCGLVKVRARSLTCMRAVPGIRLITGALARSDDDSTRHRKFVMVAKEQDPAVDERCQVEQAVDDVHVPSR